MPRDPLSAKLIRKRCLVPPGGKGFRLAAIDADERGPFAAKPDAQAGFEADLARIDQLQEVLYAEGKHALLVVLQAMDTGGKDGVVRSVFGPLSPLGVQVVNFKKPTPTEMAHDYLWRVHQQVPAKGYLGVFNRSHYEEVLVVRVHEWVTRQEIDARYDQINAFERYLDENGVAIVKIFLHISKDEQRARLEARLQDPTKQWKFDAGDLSERSRWDDYMEAYEAALRACSTAWAPWHVVPANRKWYRNALVARIVRQRLEALAPRYPEPPPGLGAITVDD